MKFNDCHKQVKELIKQHWPLIDKDTTLKTLFPKPPMIAHKKNVSIANKLVCSQIKNPIPIKDVQLKTYRNNPEPTVSTDIDTMFPRNLPMKQCMKRRCKICHLIRVGKTMHNWRLLINIRYKITPARVEGRVDTYPWRCPVVNKERQHLLCYLSHQSPRLRVLVFPSLGLLPRDGGFSSLSYMVFLVLQ